MAKVVLIRCESYEQEAVSKAVKKGIDLLGGPSSFVSKTETVLLKPNLLVAEPPKRCVTTHPAVFQAVIECFQPTGVKLLYGDSPAFGSPARVAKKAGLAQVADAFGVPLADFKNGQRVENETGIQHKYFIIANGVRESDAVISLPKLKTHGLERMTGAIKNQYGCIPGVLKAEFHVKIPDAHDFGRMLVELNQLVRPRLYIMDGILAMDGNGPRSGKPYPMHVILMSSDPVALDATVCRLVDLNPEFVPTVKYGHETGSGTYLADEIELLGDDFDHFRTREFSIKRRPIGRYRSKGALRLLNKLMLPKPTINPMKCNHCGTCIKICQVTPKAVNWQNNDWAKPPVYNYDSCIRCFCCQETCPEGAIYIRTPLLRRLLDKLPIT